MNHNEVTNMILSFDYNLFEYGNFYIKKIFENELNEFDDLKEQTFSIMRIININESNNGNPVDLRGGLDNPVSLGLEEDN